MSKYYESAQVAQVYLFDPKNPSPERLDKNSVITLNALANAYGGQKSVLFINDMAVLPEDFLEAIDVSVQNNLEARTDDLVNFVWTYMVFDAKKQKIVGLDQGDIAQLTDQDLTYYFSPDWASQIEAGLPMNVYVIPGQEAEFEKLFPQFVRQEGQENWRLH